MIMKNIHFSRKQRQLKSLVKKLNVLLQKSEKKLESEINNLISKIPILGDIIIPKEVGEGLFGISFKMKGPPGKIKTSVNPIKTLTPRFIQKIIKKNKNFK